MVVSFHTIDIEPSSDVVFLRTRQTEFNRKKKYDGKMPISANSLDQKPMHKHIAGIEHKLNFIVHSLDQPGIGNRHLQGIRNNFV